MRKVLALSALAMTAMLSATPAGAVTVLNAGMNDGCGKTTCFDERGVFKQTWSAKSFSGQMTIGQLLMDRGVLGSLDGSTFRLSFALNGEKIGTWGSYMMAGIAGDQLTFSGENFIWNPEDGDLTLILEILKPDADGGLRMASIQDPGAGGPSNDGPSDDETTDPGDGPGETDPTPGRPAVSAAPEPAAWALMISGFGLAGAALRRRGRVVA